MKYFVVGKYSTALHENKHKTIASKTTLYDFEEVLMANTLHTATKAKTKLIDTGISIYAVHIPVGWRNQTHIDDTTNKTATFIEYLKSKQKEEIAIDAGDFNFIPSNTDSTSMHYEMFVNIGMDVTWKDLCIECTKQNTWNAHDPEDESSGEVIDHVIFNRKKLKVSSGQIIEIGKPLSDHKPVWALLKVKLTWLLINQIFYGPQKPAFTFL